MSDHVLERDWILAPTNPSRAVQAAESTAGIAVATTVCHALRAGERVDLWRGGLGEGRSSCVGSGERIVDVGRSHLVVLVVVVGRFRDVEGGGERLGKMFGVVGKVRQLRRDHGALTLELGLPKSLSLLSQLAALCSAEEAAQGRATDGCAVNAAATAVISVLRRSAGVRLGELSSHGRSRSRAQTRK